MTCPPRGRSQEQVTRFYNFTRPEISLDRLKLESSNFVHGLTAVFVVFISVDRILGHPGLRSWGEASVGAELKLSTAVFVVFISVDRILGHP